MLDPSRVAAQIVSGIGFLGAGLIITRGGAIRGLTTAASVWESASIGMAAGAGLVLMALVVTALDFVIVLGYTPLGQWISSQGHADHTFTITYLDGQGVLRELLAACTANNWAITALDVVGHRHRPSVEDELVSVTVTLSGRQAYQAPESLGTINGVARVDRGTPDDG